MQVETITIPGRFNGPEGMVNGGIASALASSQIGGRASVRLHAPVPLDTPLELTTNCDSATLGVHGRVVASASTASPSGIIPPVARPADEVSRLPRFDKDLNPFPTCFVCGHLREDGMGLDIRHTPEGGIATLFDPTTVMARGLNLPGKYLWAALDCPSGYAALKDIGPGFLGTMTADIRTLPVVDEPLVVTAERKRVDGRKINSVSAIYDNAGELLASAETIWVAAAEQEEAA